MNKIITAIIIISVIVFSSCNSGGTKNEHEGHGMNKTNNDTAQHVSTADDEDVKIVSVAFTNVDTKAAASIKEIVDHYLHIKNALANDNAGEAASGAKAMQDAIAKLDKSLLTAEQKKVYDTNEDELKEHAEHIGKKWR
ncbi:MAG: DUF3347 domain-containing protein [Ferruginibacter sp.]